MMNFSF